MKISREEFFNTDKKQLIEKCRTELDRLANVIADKLGLTVYYSIEKEMIEIARTSKLMGTLELFVESMEGKEIDDEEYEYCKEYYKGDADYE